MLHDPARVQETQPWLTKVKSDLRLAEMALKAKPPLLDQVMFHSQQSVEKCFKAFLTWNDIKFPWIHDIRKIDPKPSPSRDFLTKTQPDNR